MSDPTVGERAAEFLVEHGYCSREEVKGCTEEDLRALEDRYDVTLPETYKSCMRHIGRNPGRFLEGSHFAYPGVRRQTEFAKRIAEEEDADFEFPDTAFVFHGLQGYAFDYFDTERGDDPPVYLFTQFDGEFESRRQADSFSKWLFGEIERLSSRV